MDITKSTLNINHLKMICAISAAESVKDAAESLFITQPALSNRIREAERRLNTRLFIRRGRKLLITASGSRLLESAQRILEELGRAEHDIARLSDDVEQVLRLGLPHYASFNWLSEVVSCFHQELPKVELEISATHAAHPLNDLFKRDVDIAVISSAQKELQLDKRTYKSMFLVQDELLACLSKNHKKANKGFLLAEDFADETYITTSTLPEKDREYELFFKPARILPRKVLKVGFNEAIIELVKVNMGLTIISKSLIDPYLKNNNIGTSKLGKSGLLTYWHLVFLKDSKVAEPARLLTQFLRQHFQTH